MKSDKGSPSFWFFLKHKSLEYIEIDELIESMTNSSLFCCAFGSEKRSLFHGLGVFNAQTMHS